MTTPKAPGPTPRPGRPGPPRPGGPRPPRAGGPPRPYSPRPPGPPRPYGDRPPGPPRPYSPRPSGPPRPYSARPPGPPRPYAPRSDAPPRPAFRPAPPPPGPSAAPATGIPGWLARIRPNRRIDANSAVLLPFTEEGKPDFAEFEAHLLRTSKAGITPAVNMDTGFGPQLTPSQRIEVLKRTRTALGTAPFIAGACPFGEDDDLLKGYQKALVPILDQGAVPILFQSELLQDADVVRHVRKIVAPAPKALAFELGPVFAPFGKIYDLETYRRLMSIPNLAGAKHSSLSREQELRRLEMRDRERPDWKVYTGNDLAIDMVMYGSDYLLGISTFDPEAFALRDRWWAEGDPRFFELNDALQALGAAAFREPVPAYKDSAAAYLKLRGVMKDPRPHPDCPRRPENEAEFLAPLAKIVERAKAR